MPKEKVKEYVNKLKQQYDKITPEQKVITAGIGGLLLGVTIGVLIMRKQY